MVEHLAKLAAIHPSATCRAAIKMLCFIFGALALPSDEPSYHEHRPHESDDHTYAERRRWHPGIRPTALRPPASIRGGAVRLRSSRTRRQRPTSHAARGAQGSTCQADPQSLLGRAIE